MRGHESAAHLREGKMTAAAQVADADVAFRVKAKVRRRQKALKRALKKAGSL